MNEKVGCPKEDAVYMVELGSRLIGSRSLHLH